MKPERSLLAVRTFAIALVMIAASMMVKAQMTVTGRLANPTLLILVGSAVPVVRWEGGP